MLLRVGNIAKVMLTFTPTDFCDCFTFPFYDMKENLTTHLYAFCTFEQLIKLKARVFRSFAGETGRHLIVNFEQFQNVYRIARNE
jgi:hypothetical protein